MMRLLWKGLICMMESYYLECFENFKRVQERVAEATIKSGRSPEEVQLIAVTKTVEAGAIKAVIEAGATIIGENRVQEIIDKRDALAAVDKQVHMIGTLQTNKVKYLPGLVDMIQSVNSEKLALQISKDFAKKNVIANILIEVNIGEETSKSGAAFEELEALLYTIKDLPFLKVKGLMTIPPICSEIEARGYFSKMYKLFVDIKKKNIDNINMNTLSMGMSGDFEGAILEGATTVRVGTAIFGRRVYK